MTTGSFLDKPRRATRFLNQAAKEILEDRNLKAAITLLRANYTSLRFPRRSMASVPQVPKKMNCGYRKGNSSLLSPPTSSASSARVSRRLWETLPTVHAVLTITALDCDLLVRYAHSCLIPVHVTKFRVLYAFVEITIDASHLLAPLQRSFASSNFKLPLSQEAQRSGSRS
ncbi:putative Diphthamide biosynthesis protein 1 [Trichoderma chlorosporum]